MIKKIALILIFVSFSNLYAQEIFIKTGKNNTVYDFTGPNSNPDLAYRNGSGNFYEIGYQYNFKGSKLAYSASLTFNQFNAAASYLYNNYSWETNYIGIQNVISYGFYETNNFKFSLFAGINTATLVSGDQLINTTYYKIKNNDEFSGMIYQSILGTDIRYFISEKISISLGFNYSSAFNLLNSSDEKLTFNTNQFQFGIHIPLKSN